MGCYVRVCHSPVCPIYAHIGAYVCHDHVRFVPFIHIYSPHTGHDHAHMSLLSWYVLESPELQTDISHICAYMGIIVAPLYGHISDISDI